MSSLEVQIAWRLRVLAISGWHFCIFICMIVYNWFVSLCCFSYSIAVFILLTCLSFLLYSYFNHHLQGILTHWGRVTHICVGNLAIISSDNGLSPGRRQAIIWTNAGILLIGPLETILSGIWIGIQTFSVKKIHLKMSSGKCRPFFSASMC